MGSYGIGVGRLLACIAEERHDDAGLRWPVAVAPFDVHLCSIGQDALPAAGELHDLLQLEGFTVLWDDRAERPGVQFADADLIGAPIRLTMSPRTLEANSVEVKRRECRDAHVVSRSDLLQHLRSQTDERETGNTD
jgi:prolyl-tRNA synthetase